MGGDICERHAAQFGAESGTQRNDLHRRILHSFVWLNFLQNRPTGKEGGALGEVHTALRLAPSAIRVRQPQKAIVRGDRGQITGNDARQALSGELGWEDAGRSVAAAAI